MPAAPPRERRVGVAIIADRDTTRAAIRRVLSADPELVVLDVSAEPNVALASFDGLHPNVVVVNLSLAGDEAPAVSFIRESKRRHPDVGILSLKRRVDEHLLRAALDAGADACCLATTSERRLCAAIKAVAEGATWLDPEISRILLHPEKSAQPATTPHLSPRQTAILRLLTEGYTNDEIATHFGSSEATIKTHVVALFTKLAVHDRVSAAVAALRLGLV